MATKRVVKKSVVAGAAGGAGISIGALSRATGIPVQTLRTWERRYGAPVPERKPSGHRLYSLAEVERLRGISALLAAGHRAADVLPRSDAERSVMRDTAAGSGETASPALRVGPAGEPLDFTPVLQAVRRFDRPAIVAWLHAQWSRLGPLLFLQDLAGPFLQRIGEQWSDGTIEIRHEHFATACLTDVLREVREPFDRQAKGPRVVAALLSGDRHEGGLLMAGVLLAVRGFRVVYLGVDTPAAEVVGAAKEANVAAVVVSVSRSVPAAAARRGVVALRGALPKRVAVWLGGSGSPEKVAGCTRFQSLAEMDAVLAASRR
ncbi:MAG: MerR family transcriptional regulator [Candidatus Eisenbacteria bacterium]|nr:MerR family transcriptional regulator [Candidatus Eisenbacteria bacterium]